MGKRYDRNLKTEDARPMIEDQGLRNRQDLGRILGVHSVKERAVRNEIGAAFQSSDRRPGGGSGRGFQRTPTGVIAPLSSPGYRLTQSRHNAQAVKNILRVFFCDAERSVAIVHRNMICWAAERMQAGTSSRRELGRVASSRPASRGPKSSVSHCGAARFLLCTGMFQKGCRR